MKYIYKRDKFSELSKINEILDSDNLDVDFSDTLIGGTLNRLLGFVRSNVSDANMKKYAKQLDRLLASIVVQPSLDEINENRPDDEKISLEDLTEEGQKVQSAIIYLSGVKELAEGKKEEAQKLLEQIPEEILKELPEAEKITSMVLYQEQESEFKEGDIVLYDNNKVQVVSVTDELAKVKNEEGNEIEVNIKDLIVDTENEEEPNNSEAIQLFEELKKSYEELNDICEECLKDENQRKLRSTLDQIVRLLEEFKIKIKRNENFDDIETLKSAINMAKNICNNCDVEVSESLILLTESFITEKEAVDYISNKDFDRIKKELDKKSKEWKITEEDLRNLNKELAETKGIGGISGENAKKIIDILTKAKDSLLHTKPYEEIRKKQKRYFDKLDSGRAISRKAYMKWSKNVMGLVNFYKDKLPKEVITLLSDSVEKEAISNDYVKINKEFLGVDKREDKGDLFKNNEPTDKESDIKVGTEENKLRFVGVDNLDMRENICFVMEVVSNNGGNSGFITGILFKNINNSFQFKFILGLNTKWLEGYYDGKTIESKTDKPNTKIKAINDDLNGVSIESTNKYGKVFYAEAISKSIIVNKGDQISVNYLNFSDLIEENLTEIDEVKLIDEKTMNTIDYKESKWQINKLGVLVGSTDMKASVYKISANKMDSRDGYFDPKLYDQISEIFEEEFENIDIDKLKEGDKIKYKRNNGEMNTGTVGAREDLKEDTIRVVTEKSPEGFIINKNQIVQ